MASHEGGECLSSFFDRPPVLLLAGLPLEQEEGAGFKLALEIQEAVLSFGRAAFANRQPVAVSADSFAAPLLTAVAAEYRQPARSEETEAMPPQLAIGMFGSTEEERAGRPPRVMPPGVLRWHFESFPEFLASAKPRQVVVVGGGGDGAGDMRAIQFAQAREFADELQVIEPTLTDFARGQGWDEWDVTRDLLGKIGWPGWGDDRFDAEPRDDARDDASPPGAERVVPYAYLMQRLLGTDEDQGTATAGGGLDEQH